MNIDGELRTILFEWVPTTLQYLVYAAGFLLSLLHRRKYPQPCFWLGIACVFSILLNVGQYAFFKHFVGSIFNHGDLAIFVILAILRVADIACFAMLVAAVFSGRNQPKDEEAFQ